MGTRELNLDKIKIETVSGLSGKNIIIVSDVHLGYRDKQKTGRDLNQ